MEIGTVIAIIAMSIVLGVLTGVAFRIYKDNPIQKIWINFNAPKIEANKRLLRGVPRSSLDLEGVPDELFEKLIDNRTIREALVFHISQGGREVHEEVLAHENPNYGIYQDKNGLWWQKR